MLINLLGNAMKFTPAGGAVTLRVDAVPEPDGGWRLSAEVADTGVGIPAADLPHLFQPFFQTLAGQQSTGGTGLGLAISREFARLMGGDLTAHSQPGAGSTFRVEVRLRAVEAGSVTAPEAPTRQVRGLVPDQAPCRVLVVDDEANNRDLLEHLLVPLGFETQAVDDGAKALALAAAWKPDLVLLDLRMPGMNGYEVAASLHASGGPVPKILALSATVFREDRDRAVAAGADSFLAKPFLEADLLERIRQLTGVTYCYQDGSPGSDAPAAPPTVPEGALLEAMRRLPPELVGALHRAVEAADYDLILALTEQVSMQEAVAGTRLRALARDFDYFTLHRLLAENG